MRSPVCLSVLVSLSLMTYDASAGSGRLSAAGASSQQKPNAGSPEFVIPGPQRSFLRMAGISQKITPDQVLPLLSRNVVVQGFQGTSRPTEFLILLRRYVVQARELSDLAANSGMVLRASSCDNAGSLLAILGYRVKGDCGQPGATLQTVDPERAFLAIDSGFPLPELERALQGGKPFEYPYTSSPVPVQFPEGEWTKASKKNNKEDSRDLLDTILGDSSVARLYWGLSRLDPDTAKYLQEQIGLEKLLPYAAVLDFYGRQLCIKDGRVTVPGGAAAEAAWKDLADASPDSPSNFVLKLLARDKGWLAAYFDVLSRTGRTQQAYFTDSRRLKPFYDGLRSYNTGTPSTRGAFRPAPALLLLATRLQLDASGAPLVPGNLEVWQDILQHSANAKLVRKWGILNKGLSGPDQLVQLMFALSRGSSDDGPVQVFLGVSELDSRRPAGQRLQPATVRLLAHKFEEFSDQYRIYSEFPELSDDSIALFLKTAQGLETTPMTIRANAFGLFQANVGIWQILARQGQIPNARLNESWQGAIQPFAAIKSAPQLYDAGRASLGELFRFSTGKSRGTQDEIIDLLAGPRQNFPEGIQMHRDVAARIRSVLDDQRLVSLDTLQTVGDALAEKARGKQPEEYVLLLANQTREFQMPRPIFTASEHTEWAAGIYNNHHTDVQMKTEVPKILKSATASRAQIEDARGQLASFLRDTLVGLNYAYYEPPGAQALHNNPLFVRSHDFAGETVSGIKTLWQAPGLLGQGTPAGGGAHFVGSIADLPFALAGLEQDFISPDSVQALIWREMTPELLTSAILPRWWNVSPGELHAVALYQRMGEELITAAAKDEALRGKVLVILSDRVHPQRSRQVEEALRADRAADVIPEMMPADTFYLAAEFLQKFSQQPAALGTATQELQELRRQHPEQADLKRIAHDFGTPHPSIAQNYGLELLNVPPMPPFAGSSSRFLAESWDSPILYWGRLADEGGYAPVMLNHIVPEMTRVMVEKIFATDFEDWPALLRALHEAGADFRQGKTAGSARASVDQHKSDQNKNDQQ